MRECRDFKFKFWIKISKGFFPINKIYKSRGANFIDLYILGFKINFGMPYSHMFIYQMGFDAGFTIGNK